MLLLERCELGAEDAGAALDGDKLEAEPCDLDGVGVAHPERIARERGRLRRVTTNAPQTQLDRIEQTGRTILQLVLGLIGLEGETMADLSALTAQVKANTDLEASAVQLIQGLAAQLAAAATDPAAVAALATQLKTSADSLAAAITANTPAAPPATPPSPPVGG